MLIQSPKTLEGTLVFGFVTLPWAPKRPWTLKDGPYTGSKKNNSRQFYSDYYMPDTSPRALCKRTCLIITTAVRSRLY